MEAFLIKILYSWGKMVRTVLTFMWFIYLPHLTTTIMLKILHWWPFLLLVYFFISPPPSPYKSPHLVFCYINQTLSVISCYQLIPLFVSLQTADKWHHPVFALLSLAYFFNFIPLTVISLLLQTSWSLGIWKLFIVTCYQGNENKNEISYRWE